MAKSVSPYLVATARPPLQYSFIDTDPIFPIRTRRISGTGLHPKAGPYPEAALQELK
jgi:hypothetical protein